MSKGFRVLNSENSVSDSRLSEEVPVIINHVVDAVFYI